MFVPIPFQQINKKMNPNALIFLAIACHCANSQEYNNQFDFNNNNQQQFSDNLEDYCYKQDEEPYIYFGPKTSYDTLNRGNGRGHDIPGCQPVQFWSLNRHGTRLPKSFKIARLRDLQRTKEEVLLNYEQRRSFPDRGRLCDSDYALFKNWRWNDSITEDKAGFLTSQGVTELRLLARRYRSKFPKIFNQPYSDEAYYFQYTLTDRTHDSYQAYIEGLFDNEYYRVHANTMGNDVLIKPYKNCREWQERVIQNPSTDYNYRKFLESPQYYEMARQVFRRMGFKYDLNIGLIQDMYDMCRYEKAWRVELKSAWCVAFTKNHLKLLEYAEDLKEYYTTGYGNPLVENIGCASLQDLYKRFEDTVNGYSNGNKVTALFTHAATIQAVLSTLGVAKDYTPLKADNYFQQSRRQWRTSIINPFASNLVSVLYQCQSGEPYKVGFFLNEAPLDDLPGCSVGLCDWQSFQNRFKSLSNRCNVDAFCEGRSSARPIKTSLIWFLFVISFVLLSR